MSNPPIPKRVDARKLVQREQYLDGVLAVDQLERLPAAVESISGEVRAELTFGRDLQGHATVDGRVQCAVQLLCQRCLQPMPAQVDGTFRWGIVWSEERGKALPKDLDPIVQAGDELNLYEVLEDEILLNLPMVAYHDEECVAREHFHSGEEVESAEEQQENPFKVLEQLKGSSGKS
ncbi:YceD family protein [Microbulbifer sp. SAOS-129_SWC]|uniref:YceD family protein n=1 Tax=Microbulbifer sp. SAOS-129_SWC TaxID=3145235 RepID=UPI00321780AB